VAQRSGGSKNPHTGRGLGGLKEKKVKKKKGGIRVATLELKAAHCRKGGASWKKVCGGELATSASRGSMDGKEGNGTSLKNWPTPRWGERRRPRKGREQRGKEKKRENMPRRADQTRGSDHGNETAHPRGNTLGGAQGNMEEGENDDIIGNWAPNGGGQKKRGSWVKINAAGGGEDGQVKGF